MKLAKFCIKIAFNWQWPFIILTNFYFNYSLLASASANETHQYINSYNNHINHYQQQQQQQQPLNSNQFVIKFIHNDSKNNLAYVSIAPVDNSNLHEPRIELRYQSKYPFVSIDERSPNDTVVAAIVVNDEDSGPNGKTSLSIEHGNELNHFKLISTKFTDTIQVNGAPLSKQRQSEYNLTIVARDHGSPPKWSAVNLVVKLYTSSNPFGVNSPLLHQPSSKPPVASLMYLGAMLVVTFSVLIFIIILGCAVAQKPTGKDRNPPARPTNVVGPTRRPSDDFSCIYLAEVDKNHFANFEIPIEIVSPMMNSVTHLDIKSQPML